MSLLVRFGRLIFKSNQVFHIDTSFASKKYDRRLSNVSLSSNLNFSGFHSSYNPFDESVNDRRCQARRSILVQVNSDLSFPELHSYCSQFGAILGVHHYALRGGQQHFMLVEFETEKEASSLISSGCFSDGLDVIPVQSSFLWFRSAKDKNSKRRLSDLINLAVPPADVELATRHGCLIPSEAEVSESLMKSKSLSDQIANLYEMTRLDDLGIRLRYMVARQIECSLKGLYPDVAVRPFGSTVNGFGKKGCDLDLLLRFSNDEEKDSDGRLVFHTKKSTATGRMQQQRYMEVIGDIIQLFVPGCSHVRRILQARIPIIKYNQEYAGVECDLSMASMSGVYMTELLYTFGCLDPRVRPLVFTVRKWAESQGITNPSPGRWITNFPLTLMVLFFLQNTNDGPILPSYNYLKKAAGKGDIRITEDLVNCTFLSDISKINHKGSSNTNTLDQLLLQFFEFYSSFDFSSYALSINEGRSITKPDHSALYIVNPLEVSLNVSKNVSYEESERLRIEVRNAAWQLESGETKTKNKPWGLESVFDNAKKKDKKYLNISKTQSTSPRLVSVEDLFTDKLPESTEINKSLDNIVVTDRGMDTLKSEIIQMAQKNQRSEKFQFHNAEIRKEVEVIKRDSESNLRRQQRLIHNLTEKEETHKTTRRKTRRR